VAESLSEVSEADLAGFPCEELHQSRNRLCSFGAATVAEVWDQIQQNGLALQACCLPKPLPLPFCSLWFTHRDRARADDAVKTLDHVLIGA
jgi:hypothetical protein